MISFAFRSCFCAPAFQEDADLFANAQGIDAVSVAFIGFVRNRNRSQEKTTTKDSFLIVALNYTKRDRALAADYRKINVMAMSA